MDLGAPISGKREAPCRFSCKALSVRLQTPSRTASSFHPGFLPHMLLWLQGRSLLSLVPTVPADIWTLGGIVLLF